MADRKLGYVITAKDAATAALAKLQDRLKQLGDQGKKTEKDLKGVEKVGSSFDTIGGSVDRLVGALAGLNFAGSILEQANAARDFADSLNDMSERTGIAVERLSELAYAGQLSDVSLDDLKAGLKGLAKNMAEAAGGSKEAREAFALIGVNPDGKSTDQVLEEVAEAFSGYEDGARKSALAQEIFGKAGIAMIPMLNAGKDGLAELSKEARQLGGVVGTDAAEAAAKFNDNLDKLSIAMRGVFLDTLIDSHGWLGTLIEDVVEATKQTGGLIDAILLLGKNRLELGGLSIGEQITEINRKIESKKFTSSTLYKNSPEKQQEINSEIADLTRRKEILQGQQMREALRGVDPNAVLDARDPNARPNPNKPQAPVINKNKEADESAAIEKASADLAKAQAEAKANAAINAAKRQETVIKQLLDDGKISYADYYTQQVKLQQTAIDERLKALKAERTQQEALSKSSKAKEAERIKAKAEMVKLDSEIDRLNKERATTAPDAARLQAKAEEDLADKLEEVRLKTAELLGLITPEQRQAAADRQYAGLREKLASNYGADSREVASLDQAKQADAAKAIFDDLTGKTNQLKAKADGDKQRVDVEERTGLIGTREAELRRLAIDKELAANTAAYIPLLQAQADIIGGDAVTAIEALQTQVLEMQKVVDPQIVKIADAAGNAVTGVLDGLRDGSLKTAKDVAKFFLKSVGDSIAAEGNKEIQKFISNFVKDLLGGMQGQGGLASGGGAFMQTMQGAGSSVSSAAGSAFNWVKGLFGFSQGGYTGGAGVAAPAGIVHGQEYVMSAPSVRNLGVGFLDALHRAGRRGAARVAVPGYANGGFVRSGSGGGAGVTVVQNIQTPDAESFRRSQGQLEARTGLAVQRAVKRFK